MALSSHDKRQLLNRTLPQRNQVRQELENYLQRTGLTYQDFAHRIGYAGVTMHFFLKGKYESVAANDAPIRAAIVDFIQANPIAPMTANAAGRLYETENIKLIRRYFYDALDNHRSYYLRGAPGSQKTHGVRSLIAELNLAEISKNGHGRRAYYVYCRQGIRPVDLLKRVAESCGSISTGTADRILRNLRFDFRSRKVLVVFDEAQHLDIPCLETVRELLDMPPHFGLIFAGSHELEQTFQRLDMEQWARRIRKGCELPGLSEQEAVDIIRSEIQLSERKAGEMVRHCYAVDLRKGREVKYISAGMLFDSIAAIKERRA